MGNLPFDKYMKKTDGINPIVNDIRHDLCPICKAQRVELISFNGYPQNYRDAVDALMRGYTINFDRYEIRAMKCKSCNKEFVIDWTFGFPVPLKDTYRTNRFFNEFINGY